MEFVAKEVPEIEGTPLVTDGEANIIKAISKRLPQVHHLRCWNHLQSGARYWLRKHGATTSDCTVYIRDLKELLMSPSEEVYRRKYTAISQRWSQPFLEYFNHQIDPEVTFAAGRWILEPLGIYNGYSGVTTNQSEGFNTLLKNLTERKESCIDSLVLSLYYLQCYYNNEIQRGLAGLGKYQLLRTFQSLKIGLCDMDLQHCYAPEEITERMLEKRFVEAQREVVSSENNSTSNHTSEEEDTAAPPDDILRETAPAEDRQTPNNTHDGEHPRGQEANPLPASQLARAQLIVQNKKCLYQADLKTFVVQGTSDSDTHAVKLFPKPSCTCPAKTMCYHILSAKLYMGMEMPAKSKRITMTQLRKSVRPKSSRRKGRKGPLEEDEIEPAPDAKIRSTVSCPDALPVPPSHVQPPQLEDSHETSPPTSDSQTSPSTSDSQTSPPTSDSQTSPPTSDSQTSPPTSDSQICPPTSESQTSPPTSESQTSPPTSDSQTDSFNSDCQTISE